MFGPLLLWRRGYDKLDAIWTLQVERQGVVGLAITWVQEKLRKQGVQAITLC